MGKPAFPFTLSVPSNRHQVELLVVELFVRAHGHVSPDR
jgi:hypothetical protein